MTYDADSRKQQHRQDHGADATNRDRQVDAATRATVKGPLLPAAHTLPLPEGHGPVAAADGLTHALLLDAEADSALAKLLGSGPVRQPAGLVIELTRDSSAPTQLPSAVLGTATAAYLADPRER